MQRQQMCTSTFSSMVPQLVLAPSLITPIGNNMQKKKSHQPIFVAPNTANCKVYILHFKIKVYTDLGDHLGSNSQC